MCDQYKTIHVTVNGRHTATTISKIHVKYRVNLSPIPGRYLIQSLNFFSMPKVVDQTWGCYEHNNNVWLDLQWLIKRKYQLINTFHYMAIFPLFAPPPPPPGPPNRYTHFVIKPLNHVAVTYMFQSFSGHSVTRTLSPPANRGSFSSGKDNPSIVR